MPANAASTIFSWRVSGPSAASARRAAAGASGVAVRSGAISQWRSGGMSAMPTSVGSEAASSHDPNPISTPNDRAISAPIGLAAIAVIQSADDRLRLTMPENIRKRPDAPATVVAGLGAAGFGERERQRIDDAGARGVAREGRRDQAVHQEEAVGQSQRGAAEDADDRVSHARAQTALDHGARDQEREDDEQNRAVREAGVGFRRRQQPAQHRRRPRRGPTP